MRPELPVARLSAPEEDSLVRAKRGSVTANQPQLRLRTGQEACRRICQRDRIFFPRYSYRLISPFRNLARNVELD